MKKYIGYVIAVIIGGIITAGLGVAAYNYKSEDVTYTPSDKTWKVSTVAEAINSLVNDAKGSVMNYSLDEQVVGTWIDGKTIYQKTYTFDQSAIVHYSNWYDTGISNTDMNAVISVFVVSETGTYWNVHAAVDISDTLRIQASRSNQTIDAKYLTIQYTKKSDTGNSNNS